jgi:hypothetical protein
VELLKEDEGEGKIGTSSRLKKGKKKGGCYGTGTA